MSIYRQHSVKYNFLMNFILKMSGALCAAVSYPFVFRVLGADGVGTVAFATSVVSFFTMVAALGIPTYGIRECARVRDDRCLLSKTVRELLIIQTTMTCLSVALLACTVCLIPKLRSEPIIFAIQGLALFTNCFGVEWMFAGLEQYGYITIKTTAAKLISLALIFLLVRKPDDYLIYAALLALATILSNVFNAVSLRRFVDLKPSRETAELKKHIRPILVFFAQTVAITIYTSLDSAMLGFMKGDYWVGIYDAAVKVKLVLSYFITSLGTVLLPRLSYYVHTGEKRGFQEEISKSLEFTLISALPLAVFFSAKAPESILILFGREFTQSAAALQVLMPAVLLIGLSTITGTQILIPIGKEYVAMYSYIAGAVVDLVLNWILIPRYAALGAALGTLAAELVVLAVQAVFLRGMLKEALKGQKLWRPVLAALLPAGLLILMKQVLSMPLIIDMVLSVGVYFGVTGVILVLTGEPLVCACLKRIRTR